MLHGSVIKIIDFGVADYLPIDGRGLRVIILAAPSFAIVILIKVRLLNLGPNWDKFIHGARGCR